MSFSDSFDDWSDDEDELFIALTNKPKPTSTAATSTQATHTQAVQVRQTQTQKYDELLVAKGEIAVLRAKLEEEQRSKQEEIKRIVADNLQTKHNQQHMINSLSNRVHQLEDEKKFLSAEAKKASHSPVVVAPAPVAPPKRRRIEESLKITPNRVVPDENALLVDEILSHCLVGCRKTIDILNDITLEFNFQYNDFIVDDLNKPLGHYLVQYAISKRLVWRLDDLIENLLEILVMLVNELIQHDTLLALPFLICIIHCCTSFRPNAIKKSTWSNLLDFSTQVISKFYSILQKSVTVAEDELASYRPQVFQYDFIKIMITTLAFDLLEFVACHTTVEDPSLLKTVIRNCLGKAMAVTNIVMNIAMILAKQPQLVDEDLVNMLSYMLTDIVPRPEFQLYGLLRNLGSNKNKSKLSFVPKNGSQPLVLMRSFEEVDHTAHTIQNLIIKIHLVDVFKLHTPHSPLTLQQVVRQLSIQQENMALTPKSATTPLRAQLVSGIVDMLLKEQSLQITHSSAMELTVALVRIRFGSSCDAAHAFIDKARARGYRGTLFEPRDDDNDGIEKLETEMEKLPVNGLELPYEPFVASQALDLLDRITTMETVDDLYLGMVKK